MTATLHDHMVGEEYMADYLLFHLNQTSRFDYVSHMKLDEPMDDARLMLAKTAVYQGMVENRRNIETGEINFKANKMVTTKVARWQNLIPSFPWIVPGWRAWGRNPRKGRDQILQRSVAEP